MSGVLYFQREAYLRLSCSIDFTFISDNPRHGRAGETAGTNRKDRIRFIANPLTDLEVSSTMRDHLSHTYDLLPVTRQ